MSEIKEMPQNFDWFLEQLEGYGINTANPVSKTIDSIMFLMETPDNHHIAINATINDDWILVSTFRLLKNTKLENLPIYLKIMSKLKYAKLMILPLNDSTNKEDGFYDLGFELFLENYDSEHFYLMLDCLFLDVDRLVEGGLEAKILDVVTDPITKRKLLFLS